MNDYIPVSSQCVFRLLQLCVLLPAVGLLMSACSPTRGSDPIQSEVVMADGMKIIARTREGPISITKALGNERNYRWNSCSATIALQPRLERWYGSLGIYSPGAGEQFKECNGISRAVVEEGQQHFKTVDEAEAWLRSQTYLNYVWTNNGLVVGWKTVPSRKQLSAELWQILVGGRKPVSLRSADDSKITVTYSTVRETPRSREQQLIQAADHSDLSRVKYLLENGASPDAVGNDGQTALMAAASQRQTSIVKLLLDHHANPNIRDFNNMSALLYACIVGNSEVVTLLLNAGADPNAKDRNGLTGLMHSSMRSDLSVMKSLLAHRADPNVRDNQKSTALMLAASKDRIEAVKLLSASGAMLNLRDNSGNTALTRASASGYEDVVTLLRAIGAE